MNSLGKLKQFIPTSKVKLSLLISFIFLIFFQTIVGFKYFDDYLLVFIFVLFLNDQFYKFKNQNKNNLLIHEKKIRFIMTMLFIMLFIIPSFLDAYHVSISKQFFLYKLGFIIWAQVFLVDAFYHYKETQSKKWLIFANTAMMMIVLGAFVI